MPLPSVQTQEYDMNWAETMKRNATFAVLAHVADDERVFAARRRRPGTLSKSG